MIDFYNYAIQQKRDKEEEKNRRIADPLMLVPGRNYSSIKELTSVYFGNRGLYSIANFELFVNLEVLWLNGNCLASLAGLEHNFRLKELYIFNNQLTKLEPQVFKNLTHLRTLSAYNNSIDDLTKTIEVLEPNHYLEKLDLSGNPLSNEPMYRAKLFSKIPSLKMIDWTTFNERDQKDIHKLIPTQKVVKIKPKSTHAPSSSQTDPLAGFTLIERELYLRVQNRSLNQKMVN